MGKVTQLQSMCRFCHPWGQPGLGVQYSTLQHIATEQTSRANLFLPPQPISLKFLTSTPQLCLTNVWVFHNLIKWTIEIVTFDNHIANVSVAMISH